MKKIALLLALIFSFASTLSAAKFIKGQYYGGVGLGIEDYSYYSHYDPGMTLVLNGGKPIIKLGPGTIGAELELTYTILPMDYNYRYYDADLSVLTFGTYATYTFTHSKKLYSRAKLGFALQHTTFDYDDYDYDYYDGYNKASVAIGIGGGYKFNKTMRAYSDLIIMSGGLKQLNFGVQFSF